NEIDEEANELGFTGDDEGGFKGGGGDEKPTPGKPPKEGDDGEEEEPAPEPKNRIARQLAAVNGNGHSHYPTGTTVVHYPAAGPSPGVELKAAPKKDAKHDAVDEALWEECRALCQAAKVEKLPQDIGEVGGVRVTVIDGDRALIDVDMDFHDANNWL